jgi:hypothetical protein
MAAAVSSGAKMPGSRSASIVLPTPKLQQVQRDHDQRTFPISAHAPSQPLSWIRIVFMV